MYSRRQSTPFISVVVPVYNESLVIEHTYQRLRSVLEQLSTLYEVIFVNDGSQDDTQAKLLRLVHLQPEVKVVELSRNFGHQIAVTAGIEHAQGDVVVLIDADLQDPPELIAQFLDKWRQGYDVVYAVRVQREGESWFKRWSAGRFYRFLNRATDVQIPLDTGDFRLMNRNVVDSLLAMHERHRFIRGLVSWVGFEQIGIPYVRAERVAGVSKYPLRKMVRFAVDGVTSFSHRPLQWASKLGFSSSILGFVGILAILYMKLFTHSVVRGWTSLMVVVLFLGGVQLLVLGILGEYIGRIYDEVRARPLYFVKGLYNFKHGSETSRDDRERE
ncbi:glycosyltransferase family 2 protein [Alicyclobacillus fodiniaquatilis]|uniref:Glycosyltransferase family 2 protein n=1 Tax=Alicyclobacillus fodiniaquatilis TaxID=1661150 RepID=A0ABW4JLE8_9BACL